MILLNDFKTQWAEVEAEALKALAQAGSSGWYILGEEVLRFEADLAKYWNMGHVAGTANGLDAIQIALRATGCKSGDRVLTTPVSAFATTLAILLIGATPVFVDVDQFGMIDLDQAEKVFASDPSIRHFVPVHLFGHACDLERLGHLRDRFGLTIIEDCAQSIGAKWKGKPTGSVGTMACTSFYPTKNLGCLGDGGAVLTNSSDLDRDARMLRNYGQSSKYKHDAIGWNSRLDEVHAAYLSRVALPRLDAWTMRRQQVAEAYLAGIRNADVKVVGQPVGSNSCWHLFPVLVAPEKKQDFRSYLEKQGVQTGEHYPIPIPDQIALRTVTAEIPFALSNAASFCKSEVSLPIHPHLSASDIGKVIEAVNGWDA